MILSNIQINNILKNVKNYKGCYSKDELKTDLDKGYYVVNLQNYNDGNGSHWCVLYKTKYFDFWFDSFGIGPPLNIEKLCHKLIYNTQDIQDLDSCSCGHYCIYYIMFMSNYDINSRNLINKHNNFVNLFSKDTKMNEIILRTFLNKQKIL